MSASRDPQNQIEVLEDQKLYTNFYEHYRNLSQGMVLKTKPISVQVQNIAPSFVQDLNKWIMDEHHQGKQSLSHQLNSLRNSSRRLKYLLSEMDELLKRD